jgi:hypothetical protein
MQQTGKVTTVKPIHVPGHHLVALCPVISVEHCAALSISIIQIQQHGEEWAAVGRVVGRAIAMLREDAACTWEGEIREKEKQRQ